MSMFRGSLIVQGSIRVHHRDSSQKGFAGKPLVGLKGTEPVQCCRYQAHISQCEMAGALSGLQVHGFVSNTVPPYAKKITIMQNAGGGESSRVEHLKTKLFERRIGADEAMVPEEVRGIDGSYGTRTDDSITLRNESQAPVIASTTEHRLDNTSRLFSFGVITDVQYADIPDGKSFLGTPRFYRHALEVLSRAVTHWNELRGVVAFAIHFGDLVDGYASNESHLAFAKVLAKFDAFEGGSVYHMIGNHCLYNLPRIELNKILNIPPSPDDRSYYEFSPYTGFRFVVLDGYDISVLGWPEDHPNAQMAIRLLDRINPNAEKNSPVGLEGEMKRFVKFNGGLGNDQLKWLECILQKATVDSEKVIICCHLPLHPETIDSPSCLCWNYRDVLVVLQKYPCVVACLSGHAHTGGYAMDSHGIHFVVLEAVLECPPGKDAFGVIDVYPDHLALTGKGRLTSRQMPFRLESSL